MTKIDQKDFDCAPRDQVAALCHREQHGETEVLLITSRDTGRWIVPKGWCMNGKTDAEAAAIEAWEEAGVKGEVSQDPLGSFTYVKGMDDGDDVLCRADVYAIEVDHLAKNFPESDERRRRWLPVEKAADRIAEPELRKLLLGL